MRVLGIITARGGSKGIPQKNITLLRGKPLLWYTAQAALRSQHLTRTVLSTDDEQIAAIGEECGLDVPFMRPTELAQDSTPTLPVLQHVVSALETQGEHYDAICLLQPTNPLRTSAHVDGCIQLFSMSSCDSVFTTLPVPENYNPHWTFLSTEDGHLTLSIPQESIIPQRQQLPEAYHREGSVYVVKRDVLMQENSLYGKKMKGFPLTKEHCINIDTPEDLQRAEVILNNRPQPF